MRYAFSALLMVLLPLAASAQINRGAGAMARPTPQVQRPSFSPAPAARPNFQQPRPNIQMPQPRPNFQVPQVKPGLMPQPRPNIPTTFPVNRPSLPNVNPPTTLPSTRPNLPIVNPPTTLPSTRPNLPIVNPPTTLPATRPNLPSVNPPVVKPTPLPERPGNGIGVLPARPNPGEWNRPVTLPAERPNIGVLPSRPGIQPVPPINNRPEWVNRPTINNNQFNRTNNIVINKNNFNTIAPTIYNPHRPYGGYFRPYTGNVYRPYGWANYGHGYVWGNYYAARYYHGWNPSYWNSFFWFPPGFVPQPVPLGWLLPPSVIFNYSNPYYIAPPVTVQYLNYSQPLPAPSQTVADAPIDTPVPVYNAPEEPAQIADDKTAKEAAQFFDTARAEFKKGEYAAAEKTIDKAIAKLPQDPTLHEFRALTLFAQQKFQESAAAIYAVLAAGPGWNADTLDGFYPDKAVFTQQLAALEKFAAANPANASAQFLLGYEYLTLGDKEKAIAAFDNAVKIEPKDELSAQLAKALRNPPPADEQP